MKEIYIAIRLFSSLLHLKNHSQNIDWKGPSSAIGSN